MGLLSFPHMIPFAKRFASSSAIASCQVSGTETPWRKKCGLGRFALLGRFAQKRVVLSKRWSLTKKEKKKKRISGVQKGIRLAILYTMFYTVSGCICPIVSPFWLVNLPISVGDIPQNHPELNGFFIFCWWMSTKFHQIKSSSSSSSSDIYTICIYIHIYI